MTDYGTIKLPREEYERHNERRKELGLTWAEYVDGEAPTSNGYSNAQLMDKLQQIESVQGETINESISNRSELPADVREQLDRIESALGERDAVSDAIDVQERFDDLETKLGAADRDDRALAEALADYLINGENLPTKIADELGGR